MTALALPLQANAELVSMRRLEQLLGRSRDDLLRIAGHAGRYYRPFDRRRRRGEGKWRHIDNPTSELKELQSRIQRGILAHVLFPDTMLGGVRCRSIRDNGAHHVRQPMLVTLDLRDCFPRTGNLQIFRAFRTVVGCSPKIAGLLTQLTTFQHRLPQGAPTSLTLANLTLLQMHEDIRTVAERMDLAWTFWVDDIAFSGQRALDAIEPIMGIIHHHGHAVRRSKIECMPCTTRMRVTGVAVNLKPSIELVRRSEIREEIFRLASLQDPLDWELRRVRGQINHVRYISSEQGAALNRLAERFLPAVGAGGARPRTDETRSCSSTARHSHRRVGSALLEVPTP